MTTDEKPPRRIVLQTENPTPGIPGFFAVEFPDGLEQEGFDLLRKQIEFRRKCMNQGFDNLLELIQMHEDAFRKVVPSPTP